MYILYIRKLRFLTFISLIIVILAGLLFMPKPAGAISILPAQLYLLKDTPIYNNPWKSAKPAGVLTASQIVTVVSSNLIPFEERAMEEDISWFKIKTWLGDKWVEADIAGLLGGSLDKKVKTLTTVFSVPLYDRPDTRYPTNKSVAPQKLQVTKAFHYTNWSFTNASSFIMGGTGSWYQIDTWLGKKWIKDPDALENVIPTPVSYTIKLTGQETSYPNPFVIEASGEEVEPQAVQVSAEWIAGSGPNEVFWIRVTLPEGERWLSPKNPIIKDYRELDEVISLPTKTRYYSASIIEVENVYTYNGSTAWMEPGKYEAFEASGDWKHIRTKEHGEVWVNPKRALLEQPEGIISIDEKLSLTKSDTYYYFPLTGEQSHAKGFYSPQTVKVYERWISPDGSVWYHFGSGNGEWFKRSK